MVKFGEYCKEQNRFSESAIPTNQGIWDNRRHHSDYLVALRWRISRSGSIRILSTLASRNHYGKSDLLMALFILYTCHCDDEIQVLAQLLSN